MVEWFYYADFISVLSPTQLCGGRDNETNLTNYRFCPTLLQFIYYVSSAANPKRMIQMVAPIVPMYVDSCKKRQTNTKEEENDGHWIQHFIGWHDKTIWHNSFVCRYLRWASMVKM